MDVSGQVQQLSVRPSDPNGVRTWAANANPLGYSAGLDPNGVPAYRAAEVISGSSGGKIYYISDTPAGRFINDPLFIEELKLQVGGNDALAVAERLVRGNYPAEGRRMST